MQQIKDYVEVMFKELPENEHSARLKREMLTSMEDKYEEYREKGLSEAEAIGRVIGEFGSMDDLKEVFGEMQEGFEYRDDQEIMNYLEYLPKFAKNIAFGVAIIVFATGLVELLGHFKMEALGIVFLFLTIIVGVALLSLLDFSYRPIRWQK